MKLSALALVLASALAFVPAGASGSTATDAEGALLVNWFGSPSSDSPTVINLASADAIAKVRLSVPRGYRLRLNQPVGTQVGSAQAPVYDSTGELSGWAGGDLIVEDAARHVSDPAVQACAPGSHTTVWTVVMARPGPPFRFLIFVDRPGAHGRPRAVLHLCPIWPTPGMSVRSLEIWVEGVFGPLTVRGRNTWRAFVSPPLPTLAPDESRTFEVRALEPIPHKVALRAHYVDRKRMVILSGTVTAAGEPEQGARVSLIGFAESGPVTEGIVPRFVATDASGEFSFQAHVEETTRYLAIVDFVQRRRCTGPSTAPAGCAFETASNPRPDPSILVRVRRPTDARLIVRPRDQELARRSNLMLADLPPKWKESDSYSLLACREFRPRLSTLTATGNLESQTFDRGAAGASSRSTVYISEVQARTAFAREARLAAVRCFADELRSDGYDVQRLSEIPFVALGEQTRAFTIDLPRRNIDLVSFRRGRVVVHLAFESVARPVESAAAAKVSARARRG